MRKLIALIGLFAVLFYFNSFAQEATKKAPEKKEVKKEQPEATKKTAKERPDIKDRIRPGQSRGFEGYVTSLTDFVAGSGENKISKEQAEKLLANGQPLVFVTASEGGTGRLMFVFNTDGTYAGKSLAQNAGIAITISGKVKNAKGLKYIIAEKIEPTPEKK